MGFICRAQRYNWIYLAGRHSNDSYPVNFNALAEYLSDGKLFLRVNNEFPKNIKDRLLYLTPDEVDPDAWCEELKQMLKDAAKYASMDFAETCMRLRENCLTHDFPALLAVFPCGRGQGVVWS